MSVDLDGLRMALEGQRVSRVFDPEDGLDVLAKWLRASGAPELWAAQEFVAAGGVFLGRPSEVCRSDWFDRLVELAVSDLPGRAGGPIVSIAVLSDVVAAAAGLVSAADVAEGVSRLLGRADGDPGLVGDRLRGLAARLLDVAAECVPGSVGVSGSVGSSVEELVDGV